MVWNGSPISKHTENPLVLVINNSLVVIGFDEMTPQNKMTMTEKRGQKRNHHQLKKLCKPLEENQSNTMLNLSTSIMHKNGMCNECLNASKKRLLSITF
ncbi:hypothetical protein AVEN_38599-1 [Araneus ventricosus]|uniref:Uncharacterized protein n=1 Tax=Araneus ventricosus TaxID=182803 RepID=A0A4Y2LEX6_ARAVE|nr:hypothetical protein AVEN_38599-1 [Araneus ventricosus]